MPPTERTDRGLPTIVRAEPPAAEGLARLFEALEAAGDDRHFRPHPLTRREAERICHYRGLDEYRVALVDAVVVGYGMLRGWDEGFEAPSLGIAVHPDHRHQGIGRALMAALHCIAVERGAASVRLRVHPNNRDAIALYRSVGYRFDDSSSVDGSGQLLAWLDVASLGPATDG
jgi:ribosomal protein S18 acetylase RimI-like enzyme